MLKLGGNGTLHIGKWNELRGETNFTTGCVDSTWVTSLELEQWGRTRLPLLRFLQHERLNGLRSLASVPLG